MVSGRIVDDFNLDKIADSGQCFRWEKQSDGAYSIIHLDKRLKILKVGQEYELSCTMDDYKNIWYTYFDFDTKYSKIRQLIDRNNDRFMYNAVTYGKGIRILRQDTWEMLISFIISQRKNIPAIKSSIEKLSRLCGTRHIDETDNTEYYSIPTPEQILKTSVNDLNACGLGYRVDYIKSVAKEVYDGKLDIKSLENMSYEQSLYRLKQLYGVGDKVANCVILFGLHNLDAFPIDIWIQRILENEYNGENNYPFEKYRPYNGVFQQYMYAYYRNRGD